MTKDEQTRSLKATCRQLQKVDLCVYLCMCLSMYVYTYLQKRCYVTFIDLCNHVVKISFIYLSIQFFMTKPEQTRSFKATCRQLQTMDLCMYVCMCIYL